MPPYFNGVNAERTGESGWTVIFGPQSSCKRLGAMIVRGDQMNDVGPSKVKDSMIDTCNGCFECVSQTPSGANDAPPHFCSRPVMGSPWPDAADPCPARFFDNRIHAEALKRPRSAHRRHGPPGGRRVLRSAQMARGLLVGHELAPRTEMIQGRLNQPQAFGFNGAGQAVHGRTVSNRMRTSVASPASRLKRARRRLGSRLYGT